MSNTSIFSSFSSKMNSSKVISIENNENMLPLLFIPGIASSGLEVRESSVNENHIGDRVWLDPIAYGYTKTRTMLTSKKEYSFQKRPEMPKREDESSDDSSSEDVDSDEDEDNEQVDIECKSAWMKHMLLTSDLCTEREGNKIRAIPGLDGVDFLTDVSNINIGASYVFAPVMKLLHSIGYAKGINFDAVPYDWRVPPFMLEQRDQYFSKTMMRIRYMCAQNDGKPVVLLCHSMGCKAGHYLLNFVLEKMGPVEGRNWIDKHIHTFMPLGGVHIGSPSMLTAVVTGNLNPMIDMVLRKQDRMVLGRSMGSFVWLMPRTLPSLERNAPPTVICKKEGRLIVEILTRPNPLGDLRKLVTNRWGTREVDTIRIKVGYGDKITNTNRSKIYSGKGAPVDPPVDEKSEESQYVEFPCPRFIFPTPSSLLDDAGESILKPIRLYIQERGHLKAHYSEPRHKAVEFFKSVERASMLWNQTAKAVGKHKTCIGMSTPIDNIDAQKLIEAGEEGINMTVPIYARVDMTLRTMQPKMNPRTIDMTINVRWEAPTLNEGDDLSNPICAFPGNNVLANRSSVCQNALFAPVPEVDSSFEYIPLSGQAILREEGLNDTFVKLARDKYDQVRADPVGPRDRSSIDRPPVKRVCAIYGINLETQVSAVYKRVDGYHEDETPLELLTRPHYEVDTKASLKGVDESGSSESGHKLQKGILIEHKGTPQIDLLTGERVFRSGDKSVPYWCLQQPQVWKKEIENDPEATERGETVRIEEIEGAEHRAILSDERFHNILVEYLTGKKLSDFFPDKVDVNAHQTVCDP